MNRLFVLAGRMALLVLLLIISGCAARHPWGEPLEEPERVEVERAFAAAMEQRRRDLSCIDAEVEIQWRTLLRSGVLPGYLQALRPAWFKFVGVDPLGRPLVALAGDGENFRLILVNRALVYEGPVTAPAFKSKLPPGLDGELLADSLFALLSGEAPLYGASILSVRPDLEGRGYWLEPSEPPGVRMLFRAPLKRIVGGEGGEKDVTSKDGGGLAPVGGVIGRITIHDPDEVAPSEIIYDDYRALPGQGSGGELLLPRLIEVNSPRHQGLSLTMTLADFHLECEAYPPDFTLPVPPTFKIEQLW